MRNRLQTLGELQQIDLRLDGISGNRNSLLAEIEVLDRKLTDAGQEIAAKEEEIAMLEEERQGLESTLKVETENIIRSESRLKEIKTQKEYLAVSKEISVAKKLKSELEDQLLQKIGLLEERKSEISVSHDNFAKLEINVEAQKNEVKDKVSELDASLAADNADREAKATLLPPPVLKRYTTLRGSRRGLAVVEATDGRCLGCNMNLPPQLFNSLYRAEELITCPHCMRMLILRPQQQE